MTIEEALQILKEYICNNAHPHFGWSTAAFCACGASMNGPAATKQCKALQTLEKFLKTEQETQTLKTLIKDMANYISKAAPDGNQWTDNLADRVDKVI